MKLLLTLLYHKKEQSVNNYSMQEDEKIHLIAVNIRFIIKQKKADRYLVSRI